MTKERGQDLLLLAVVASVLLHVALMFLVRSKVMTRAANGGLHVPRREPVRMQEFVAPADPVRMERIKDILAAKAAPKAGADDLLAPAAEADAPLAKAAFTAEPVAEPSLSPVLSPIAATAPRPAEVAKPAAPPIDPVLPAARILAAPASAPAVGPLAVARFASAAPALGRDLPAVQPGVESFGTRGKGAMRFEPRQEVTEELDERLVTMEKAAVRSLLGDGASADLADLVEAVTTVASDDSWIYFQTRLSPRAALAVVPKDVVVLLDASGSLGSDRLGSCRSAAKRILRSAMNSGDRFNLVAFRNRFEYAFTRWQECTASSFAQADKWLLNLTSHGRTDVFATIRSVLTLPRDPSRPLIALVVTDGEANAGVSETSEILSKFTALNDGLISVYMYGVKGSANRELIDVLTHGNRGESFVFDGIASWRAGSGLEALSERFRDPVLSDLRLVFTSGSQVEAYPRLLKNLYRGDVVTVTGRAPKATKQVRFSLKGLNGSRAYEGLFTIDLARAAADAGVISAWAGELEIDGKLR